MRNEENQSISASSMDQDWTYERIQPLYGSYYDCLTTPHGRSFKGESRPAHSGVVGIGSASALSKRSNREEKW